MVGVTGVVRGEAREAPSVQSGYGLDCQPARFGPHRDDEDTRGVPDRLVVKGPRDVDRYVSFYHHTLQPDRVPLVGRLLPESERVDLRKD